MRFHKQSKKSPFPFLFLWVYKMKLNRLLPVSALLVAGLLSSGAAMAATTDGGTFGVKIAITSECTVDATKSNLDFGSTASTATSPVSANNGGFSVTCTNQTPYQMGLQSTASGAGTGGSGSMTATVNSVEYKVDYQLYQDAGTTAWGNNNAASPNTKSAVGSGVAQPYTVYGKTTSTLNVPAATYNDTVAISVYY